MPISCKDIAVVADGLVQQAGEAEQRSAASRHYYAAMHRCEEWKASMPGVPSAGGYPGGSHQQLLNQLKNLDPQCTQAQKIKGRVLSAKLGALRIIRVTADYDLLSTLTPQEALQQQSDANALIAQCDAAP